MKMHYCTDCQRKSMVNIRDSSDVPNVEVPI